MIITSHIELIKFVESTNKTKVRTRKTTFNNQETQIRNMSFRKITFSKDFHGIDITSCKFFDCIFENIWGFFLIFQKCKFKNCKFINSRFSHFDLPIWDDLEFDNCRFNNVQLDEGSLINGFFKSCYMNGLRMIGISPFANVHFEKCNIENTQFESVVYYKDDSEIDTEFQDFIFTDCEIETTYFDGVDLRNSAIVDTTIYKSSFIDCQLSRETIFESKENKKINYGVMDFQTILKSDNLDIEILKKYFNINNPNIKSILQDITSPLEFKTVFISYSFKDKDFASKVNLCLIDHGVKTFIWEKDAPSGHSLVEIMKTNINKHDKILFIASQNSIKSSACQFELTEGRKRQENTWEDIFVPIHIDNYLFSITKDKIRPVLKADEYWENIEEIKRINSTDFIAFNSNKYDQSQFDEAMKKIITALKLNT